MDRKLAKSTDAFHKIGIMIDRSIPPVGATAKKCAVGTPVDRLRARPSPSAIFFVKPGSVYSSPTRRASPKATIGNKKRRKITEDIQKSARCLCVGEN